LTPGDSGSSPFLIQMSNTDSATSAITTLPLGVISTKPGRTTNQQVPTVSLIIAKRRMSQVPDLTVRQRLEAQLRLPF
jgi:hypothetical protein